MKKNGPIRAVAYRLAGQETLLLPQKCLYWPQTETLLLSDWHLGKAGHFRKAGVPVPGQVHRQDFAALEESLLLLAERGRTVRRLLVLGDLFHAEYNREWELLAEWLDRYPDLGMTLVTGNHDVLPPEQIRQSGIEQHEELREGPFLFTHHPLPASRIPEGAYNLCGHVHPCVTLRGRGGDRLRLPCYHFGARQGTLPAFGRFTGGAVVKPKRQDEVFVVAEASVIRVSGGAVMP